jgi:hypothetical protein
MSSIKLTPRIDKPCTSSISAVHDSWLQILLVLGATHRHTVHVPWRGLVFQANMPPPIYIHAQAQRQTYIQSNTHTHSTKMHTYLCTNIRTCDRHAYYLRIHASKYTHMTLHPCINTYIHGHGHGHGHGVFILATYPKGKWRTNPNPLYPVSQRRPHIHAYIHQFLLTYIYMHAIIHTYIDTYTHTYTRA